MYQLIITIISIVVFIVINLLQVIGLIVTVCGINSAGGELATVFEIGQILLLFVMIGTIHIIFHGSIKSISHKILLSTAVILMYAVGMILLARMGLFDSYVICDPLYL